MPLPWKKNRVTRITQIVADLNSPKRGGSLVVETGFPTSLIDLFVKNRSRFKIPKAKKRVPLEISHPLPPTVLRSPSPPQEPSNSSNRTVLCDEPRYTEAPSWRRLGVENVPGGDDRVVDSDQELNQVGGSDAKKVLAAILKMFVVLVVTLSVKKLTVGITMSAFVLLFLEFAGKLTVFCLKPCSNANMAFRSLAQKVSSRIWFQNLVSVMKKRKSSEDLEPALVHGKIVVSESVDEVQLSSSSSSMEQIEIAETKSETGNNSFNMEKKWVCSEMEVVQQCKSKEKKGDKFKSKMVKKFVPKKLRGSKGSKEREADSCREVPSSVEEDKSGSLETEDEQQNGNSQNKTEGKKGAKFKSKMVKKFVPKKLRGSKRSTEKREAESFTEVLRYVEENKSASSEIEEEKEEEQEEEDEEEENGNRSPFLLFPSKLESIKDDDEVDHGITCSSSSSSNQSSVAVSNVKEKIDDTRDYGNSGCIVLFLIALAGLVVGRFPALTIIMTWLFLLKIVKSRGRSVNVPLIKCSIQNSS